MKLYTFVGGYIHSTYNLSIKGGEPRPIFVPAPFYLVEHPLGYVLFDTGYNKKAIEDPAGFLGKEVYDDFAPELDMDHYVVNSLEKIGVKPEDVKFVVMSHLHYDHAGGLESFKNAKIIVHKTEFEHAYENMDTGFYFSADFDHDLDWFKLEIDKDTPYDLFDDGKVKIYFTPGHTPGHMSMQVDLEKEGRIFLTADCVYCEENVTARTPSPISFNEEDYIRGIDVLRLKAAQGVKIIIGHDADQKVKIAPEYYE